MDAIYTPTEIKEKLYPIFDATPIIRAILFGSYAKGNPSQLSDIDILIDSGGEIRGIEFFGVLEDITEILRVPVDLIDMSQLIDGGRIQHEIEETGVVIYERT